MMQRRWFSSRLLLALAGLPLGAVAQLSPPVPLGSGWLFQGVCY